MATNDDLQDEVIRREVRNLRAIGGIQNDVDRRLRVLQRDLRALVERINPNGVKTLRAKRRREAALAAEAKVIIASAYAEINALVRAALTRIGAIESRSLVAAINKALPREVSEVQRLAPKAVAREVTQRLATQSIIEGTVMRDHWRRLSTRTQNAVADVIRTGIRDGLSNQRITTTIVGGTVDGVRVPGVMDTSRRNASVLVRTGVNGILNAAREATIANNLDIVGAIQQISTLDGRTSDICIAYSGGVWNAETFEPIPPTRLPYNGGPPRHFNCRSTIVPVLKAADDLNVDLSPTTRASMDGQVPADITFAQWLRKKPKSFQDEVLGPGRAKLWRANRISLQQLVDMRGNPLSLSQLEQMVNN